MCSLINSTCQDGFFFFFCHFKWMCVHFPCFNCLAGVQASTCLVVSRVFRSGPQVSVLSILWLRGGEGRGSLKVPSFPLLLFYPCWLQSCCSTVPLASIPSGPVNKELSGNEYGVHQHTLQRAKMGITHFGVVVPACCTKYSRHWECAMNTVCWAVVITLGWTCQEMHAGKQSRSKLHIHSPLFTFHVETGSHQVAQVGLKLSLHLSYFLFFS